MHVTRDALDLEYAGLLNTQASVTEIRQDAAALTQVMRSLEQTKHSLHSQASLDELEYKLEIERIRRDIANATQQVAGDYRVSARRLVAHILVHPGMAVRKGQVLAKLRRPDEQLEAVLYVSTAHARLMRPGQSVEIILDAYPHQVFGTLNATVSSISGVAQRGLAVDDFVPRFSFFFDAHVDFFEEIEVGFYKVMLG